MRMMIPRRDDFLFPVEQAFDKFFSEFFGTPVASLSNGGYPKLNAVEEDGQLVLTFSVPGLKSDDLTIEIREDNVLIISGRKQTQSENTNYHIRELRQSAFERCLKLPDYVAGDPKTTLKDGLLTLRWSLPKEAAAVVRKIPIESTSEAKGIAEKLADHFTTTGQFGYAKKEPYTSKPGYTDQDQ